MQTPRYLHDCADCVYLGSAPDETGEVWDLYACQQGRNDDGAARLPTLLLRWGSGGGEYTSSPVMLFGDRLARALLSLWWRERVTHGQALERPTDGG